MKAHIARNQNAGVPLVLGWNLSHADRGKLEGLEPGAYPPAVVLANFKEKDVDTLLDLMKQAQVTIPLKAVVTPSNRSWVFGDLLAHLQEEHAAFTAAKENRTV